MSFECSYNFQPLHCFCLLHPFFDCNHELLLIFEHFLHCDLFFSFEVSGKWIWILESKFLVKRISFLSGNFATERFLFLLKSCSIFSNFISLNEIGKSIRFFGAVPAATVSYSYRYSNSDWLVYQLST